MTLSVIIPARNATATLPLCLEAVRRAGTSDMELIVVDDGSTDTSAEVARAHGATVIRTDTAHGPAAARNLGVRSARGSIVFFLDADVVARTDSVSRVLRAFAEDPDLGAVFGSYDASPTAGSLVSDYRNLLHHFTHQQSCSDSESFWAGCGAVRRSVFLSVGGFDEGYRRPSIEDIEFGLRLTRAGHRIRLDKDLQVTHLKRWTLLPMLQVDIRDRAYPWSRLILERRTMRADLNLRRADRACAGFVWVAGFALLCVPVAPVGWQLAPVMAIGVSLGGAGWLNRSFYLFLARRRGIGFVLGAFWLHMLYYGYASATFGWAWVRHRVAGMFSRPTAASCETPAPRSR